MLKKIKKFLHLNTNEVRDDGVALEVDVPPIRTNKQVVRKKRVPDNQINKDSLQK